MERKNVSFEQLSDIMAFRVARRHRRELLRGAGRDPRRLPHAARPLQGLHQHAEAATATARCTPPIIGPEGSARSRCRSAPREMHEVAELGVAAHWAYKQHAKVTEGRQYRWIRELARHPGARQRRRGVPREHQARDVPGPGVLLHAQGRPDRPAARRHAGRLRLRGALPGRRPLRGRQDRRPHGPAPHPAAERRPGRDHHQQELRHALAGVGALRRHRQGAGADPPLPSRARSATST